MDCRRFYTQLPRSHVHNDGKYEYSLLFPSGRKEHINILTRSLLRIGFRTKSMILFQHGIQHHSCQSHGIVNTSYCWDVWVDLGSQCSISRLWEDTNYTLVVKSDTIAKAKALVSLQIYPESSITVNILLTTITILLVPLISKNKI